MGDGGRIISLSSGAATRVGWRGLADYASTKAAVDASGLYRANPLFIARVRVERCSGALHDLLRDHDLLGAFEAWQIEHKVKEYSLHNG